MVVNRVDLIAARGGKQQEVRRIPFLRDRNRIYLLCLTDGG